MSKLLMWYGIVVLVTAQPRMELGSDVMRTCYQCENDDGANCGGNVTCEGAGVCATFFCPGRRMRKYCRPPRDDSAPSNAIDNGACIPVRQAKGDCVHCGCYKNLCNGPLPDRTKCYNSLIQSGKVVEPEEECIGVSCNNAICVLLYHPTGLVHIHEGKSCLGDGTFTMSAKYECYQRNSTEARADSNYSFWCTTCSCRGEFCNKKDFPAGVREFHAAIFDHLNKTVPRIEETTLSTSACDKKAAAPSLSALSFASVVVLFAVGMCRF